MLWDLANHSHLKEEANLKPRGSEAQDTWTCELQVGQVSFPCSINLGHAAVCF